MFDQGTREGLLCHHIPHSRAPEGSTRLHNEVSGRAQIHLLAAQLYRYGNV